jgi:hypothetical protein
VLYFLIVSLSLNVLLGIGFFASWWTDRDMRLHRRLARAKARLPEEQYQYDRANRVEEIAALETRLLQKGEPLDRYRAFL